MKNKKLSILLILSLAVHSGFSQIPSYIPKNGLVGWWPFNGNTNDSSGNQHHGTINSGNNGNITFSADRTGKSNSSVSFKSNPNWNQLGPYISIKNNKNLYFDSSYTINMWVKVSSNCEVGELLCKGPDNTSFFSRIQRLTGVGFGGSGSGIDYYYKVDTTKWFMLTFTRNNNNDSGNLFLDGTFITTGTVKKPIVNSYDLTIGATASGGTNGSYYPYQGKIDDIAIWNRVLNADEVKKLLSGCLRDEITSEPVNNSKLIGSVAKFEVTTKSGSSFEWQSNWNNMNWINIPNNSTYSGGTSSSLSVSNIGISNHKQQFRAIVTNGPCKDTSKVVEIIITDTCINTKSISVSDTLKFAVNLTGVAPPNNRNAMKVYPNPTNSAIVIDNGNFISMNNYTTKIENSIGQQVFSSNVNQQQFVVDVSTLGGKGTYTLSVWDASGKLLETKKIVLQ